MSTIRGKKLVIDLIRHANQDLIEAEGLLADLGMQLNPAGIYMLGAVRTMVKRLEKANTPERMSPERVKVKAIGTWPGYTGIEVPEGAVYVGREMYGHPGSPFANPYKPSAETREAYAECVGLYRTWLLSQPELVKQARRELAGRDLACWCRRKTWPCHAGVLLEFLANDESPFTDAKRRAYLYGDCILLALAVGELTGWPVVQIVVAEDDERQPELMRHALVQMPDGRLLDADGPHDLGDESRSQEITHNHQVVMLAAYAVPFDPADWDWDTMDQDAHLWRTPEVRADAAVLAEFAEDILRRPWPE